MEYFSKFIVIFIIGVLALTVDDVNGKTLTPKEKKEAMDKVHNKCVETTGVNEGAIQKARNGEFDDSNQKFKCYSKCVMFELGAMKKNGDLDYKTFSEYLPDDKKETVKKMFQDCAHFTDDDLCQRAFNVFKCTYESDPEHYFII